MISIFIRIFGNNFFHNAIFTFTRWSMDSRSEEKRKTNAEKSMDKFIAEFSVILNQEFKIIVRNDQFVFLDNNVIEDAENREEIERISMSK